MEALERRELMAGDVAAIRHNSLVPTDVNGDFEISPVDVLQVINALGRQSRGALSGSSAGSSMYDVNNDASLSPIDALMVINRLATGEGVGELAAIDFQVLNASGAPLTPTTGSGGVAEYTVAPGERFTLRTRARDLRTSPPPTGVFSAYVDINYATVGSPSSELALAQWGEVQVITLPSNVTGGSYTLTYGAETTAPIAFTNNAFDDIDAIANAVGALSFVGGASNLRVTSLPAQGSLGPLFNIYFVADRARLNVQDAAVGTNNLTVSGGGSNQIDISSLFSPATATGYFGATSFPENPTGIGSTTISYSAGGPAGALVSSATGFLIDNVGGFLGSQPSLRRPGDFFSIFDTAFKAAANTGSVDFNIGSTGTSQATVALFGEDEVIPDNMIDFPDAFRIVIASDLVAVDDTANVAQDSAATNIVVGSNDIFKTGTNFTVTAATAITGGTVTPVGGTSNAAAAVRFQPTPGFAGQATFTYTITNDQSPALTSTATVTVNVNAPNNPPVALNTPLSATEAGPEVFFTPVQLFSPGNGESSQTVILSNAALVSGQPGSIRLDGSGNVGYTPSSDDFFGNVLFTVIGTDNGTPAASTTATFTISVADVNDPPVATGTNFTTAEDVAVTILASDLFAPGPANESSQQVALISATALTGQTGGTIVVESGNARFTPTQDFNGTFVFVAVARDGESTPLDSLPSTVTITVTPVNDPPTAVNDTGANNFTAVAIASQTTDLDVMRNDSSGDVGDSIRITSLGTLTGAGTISISGDGLRVVYTPGASSVNTTESFSYTITDGGGLTSTATAEVQVVPPRLPFAINDPRTVAENSSQLVIDVLANDLFNVDATKRLVSFAALSDTNAGVLVLLDNATPSDTSDDKIGFTPASNFAGNASFTYVMTDSAEGSPNETGTVFLTVTEVNDPPSVLDKTAAGVEDTVLTIDSATILAGSSQGANEANQTLTITAVSVLTSGAGTAVISGGNVVFTPAADFNGPALLRYTATDNGTTNGVPAPLSASATITVNLAPVNDAPLAANDSATTAEGVPLTLTAASVLSNDRPGPATALDEVGQTLSLVSVAMVSGSAGTVALVGGNIVFTPPAFFNGSSAATYVIQDSGTGNPQATATIAFTVTPVNDPPVPVAATRTANATIPIDLNLTAELAQASRGGGADEASQTVRINRVIALAGTRGTVSLNADGTIRYLAPAGFSGADTFDYEIIDNGTTNGIADPKVGTARITVNVAEFLPSTISGQVWIDDDLDGSLDSDELFVNGVEIVLTGRAAGATADITPIRLPTLSNGQYTFPNLVPGEYVVSFTPPTDFVDAPGPNSVSRSIVVPGGVNLVHNFSVYGLEPGYHTILENAESAFYLRNGQHWRELGLTALVRPNGTTAWTVHRGGFEDSVSNNVTMNASGQVTLTIVLPSLEILETQIPRGRYLSSTDAAGNTIIRVLATHAELTFRSIGSAAGGEGESFAASVDRIFSEMGRS